MLCLLDNIFVLSIILTDLTLQNENQEKLKRRTKQLEQKNKELENANKELGFQIEEKEKRGAELVLPKQMLKNWKDLTFIKRIYLLHSHTI